MGKTLKDNPLRDAARELGRKGGQKTAKKFGKKHFQELGRARWDKEKNNES